MIDTESFPDWLSRKYHPTLMQLDWAIVMVNHPLFLILPSSGKTWALKRYEEYYKEMVTGVTLTAADIQEAKEMLINEEV